MSLSAEQEADCQEAFTLFDRGGAGKLKVAELGGVLRALGHNLAGDELCVVPPCLPASGLQPRFHVPAVVRRMSATRCTMPAHDSRRRTPCMSQEDGAGADWREEGGCLRRLQVSHGGSDRHDPDEGHRQRLQGVRQGCEPAPRAERTPQLPPRARGRARSDCSGTASSGLPSWRSVAPPEWLREPHPDRRWVLILSQNDGSCNREELASALCSMGDKLTGDQVCAASALACRSTRRRGVCAHVVGAGSPHRRDLGER